MAAIHESRETIRNALCAVLVAALALAAAVGCTGDDSDAPTGRIVVFGSPDVLLVPAAGGKPERLSIGDREFWDAAFSPDGSRVAFNLAPTSDFDAGVTLLDLKDRRTTVVPNQPSEDRFESGDLTWAPDGRTLAFVNGETIFVISVDGGDLREVARGAFPSWTRDSERIVFVSGWDGNTSVGDMTVIGVDGSERRLLGRGLYPAVSPSGEEVAYSTPTGVFVQLLTGGTPRLVVPNGFGPVWSPDGKFLAFTRYTECGEAACSGRVFVMPVGGGEPRAVGPTMGDPGGPGQWIP